MTIQDLGAIGELLGAIAVCATLVYLSIQVRQSNKATRAQIHQSRSEQAQDLFLAVAASGELSAIITKVNFNPERLSELDEIERHRLLMYCVAAMQRQQNMYFQKEAGFLSEEIYKNQEQIIVRSIPLWKALDIPLIESFREELERIQREWSNQGGA